MVNKKQIIGRKDVADFPELGLEDIAVKIDTGAFTSSIHCHHIRIETDEEGNQFLKFNLLDPDHAQYHGREFSFDQFYQKVIKNSFGESEERYVIETNILLFGEKYALEVSLTDRGNLRFPVLLGRKLLEHFIVDVTKSNLSLKSQKPASKP